MKKILQRALVEGKPVAVDLAGFIEYQREKEATDPATRTVETVADDVHHALRHLGINDIDYGTVLRFVKMDVKARPNYYLT